MPGENSLPFATHYRRLRFSLSSTLLLLSLMTPTVFADDSHKGEPLDQRTRFLAAKKALDQGDGKLFLENAAKLRDYPLYPYLSYWRIRKHLDKQSNSTIQTFIDSYGETPLASQLRRAWLRELAAKARWKDYLTFYKGSNNTRLQCYAHLAELNTGNVSAAWAGAKKLWLVGHSQDESCDPLFAAWEKAGGITKKIRWQRIEMAMNRGKGGLASYLAKPLDKSKRDRVALWRRVENQPELIMSEPALKKDTEFNRHIVIHAMKRLARRDPAAATSLWPRISKRYRFTKAQQTSFANKAAMYFALDRDSRALDWFAKLPEQKLTADNTGWAVRAALREGDWKSALDWIGKIPAKERKTDQWQYWEARAQEALGEKEKAGMLYNEVSEARSYYGFLAADRSNNPYNLSHESLEVSDEALAQLELNPALIRAHELYHLTLTREARFEWDYAVSKMSREERLAAGKLADAWQWHDRALLTLAKARHFDDLNIRFPLAHRDAVTNEAEKYGLDPAWIYAVARQESAFIEDVRSSAGALGLMQLMPGTGRTIARQLKTKISNDDLLEPETNIRFGSYYLHQVLDRFDSNPVMATAAYNAGPHRIERWKPKEGLIDADIWVDNIPFNETRKYVRRVMAYSVFYDHRLNRPIRRLNLRMPAVGETQDVSSCDDCESAKDDKG